MAESQLRSEAVDFAVSVLRFCEKIKGHYSLVNQLERSATSIGANIHEANYAHSKADFIAKFQIALIRYRFCDMLLLDEPINNLDYGNVRNFSNVLTQVYKAKPELGIILVTHCRSIPIVNRIIEIDTAHKAFVEGSSYECSSCFGTVDGDCMYR